jgi:hypothetical protein
VTELQRDGRTVYVPSPTSPLRKTIRAGSGIVGTTQADGRILIDYEGNLYGAVGLEVYEERVFHAYDRHTWHGVGYPTVARQLVDRDEVIKVGTYNHEAKAVEISRRDLVDEWCNEAVPA